MVSILKYIKNNFRKYTRQKRQTESTYKQKSRIIEAAFIYIYNSFKLFIQSQNYLVVFKAADFIADAFFTCIFSMTFLIPSNDLIS